MVIRIEGKDYEKQLEKIRKFLKENNIYYNEFTSAYEAVAFEEIEASMPAYQLQYHLNNDDVHALIPEIASGFHNSKAWNNVFGDLASEADIYTKEFLEEEH